MNSPHGESFLLHAENKCLRVTKRPVKIIIDYNQIINICCIEIVKLDFRLSQSSMKMILCLGTTLSEPLLKVFDPRRLEENTTRIETFIRLNLLNIMYFDVKHDPPIFAFLVCYNLLASAVIVPTKRNTLYRGILCK